MGFEDLDSGSETVNSLPKLHLIVGPIVMVAVVANTVYSGLRPPSDVLLRDLMRIPHVTSVYHGEPHLHPVSGAQPTDTYNIAVNFVGGSTGDESLAAQCVDIAMHNMEAFQRAGLVAVNINHVKISVLRGSALGRGMFARRKNGCESFRIDGQPLLTFSVIRASIMFRVSWRWHRESDHELWLSHFCAGSRHATMSLGGSMGTCVVDNKKYPGVLYVKLTGKFSLAEMRAYQALNNAAVEDFGASDYRVFADMRELQVLSPECARNVST